LRKIGFNSSIWQAKKSWRYGLVAVLSCVVLAIGGDRPSTSAPASINNSNSANQMELPSNLNLNKTLMVGTDVAAWFLFDPQALAHREQDPCDWWTHDFAIRKELAAGNLLAVDTGSDGGFKVRFSTEGLSDRERAYVRYSREFRLRTLSGKLYFDGGYALSCDDPTSKPEEDPENWVELAKGDYRATVHTIDWYEEPGSVDSEGTGTETSLPAYVVVLESVPSLELISPPAIIPRMEPDLYSEEPYNFSEESEEIEETPLKREYALFIRNETIFPKAKIDEIPISKNEFQQLDFSSQKITAENVLEILSRSVVISPSNHPQQIATLFGVVTLSASNSIQVLGEDRFVDSWSYSMDGHGEQRVQIIRSFKRNGVDWVEVKPYTPQSEPVPDTLVQQLKQLFANYAATSPSYPKRIKYAHFYAERMESLTEASEIAWLVANALDLAPEIQRELLSLPEKELVERLIALLEAI